MTPLWVTGVAVRAQSAVQRARVHPLWSPPGAAGLIAAVVVSLVVPLALTHVDASGFLAAPPELDARVPPERRTADGGPGAGGLPSGGYAFSDTKPDGTPVRFDRCQPLTVRYDPQGEPYPAEADLRRAVDDLARAMRRDVRWGGTGDFGFVSGATLLPVDEGTITVAWSPDAGGLPDGHHDDHVLGVGGTITASDRVLAGQVVLNASADLRHGDGPNSTGAVIRHELAHAVGLDHAPTGVTDTLMAATLDPSWSGRFGTVDIAGLRQLGGPCPTPGTRPYGRDGLR